MTQSSLLLSDDLSICTSRDGNCLWVLVRSHQIPHRPATVALIRQRLGKLDVRSVRWVRILGHQVGRRSPAWSHEIDLWREASLTAVERATLATSMISRRAARKHFRTWMLGVSVPASLVGAHWFSEVVGLTSEDTSESPLGEATRFTSSDVTDLETAEPKPAAPEMPLSLPWFNRYERGLERALAAAELGQTARSPEAWAAVAERWEQAIAAMESVPATSPEFTQAQEKITEYQRNLEYVEQQPDYYREAIAHAIEAVEFGKQATTRPQWQAAADSWQRAIAALQTVEPTHDAYAEAQGRIPVYQRYLDYTRSQAETSSMTLLKTLRGQLSPKSISTSGQGTFFVPNGMQRHSIAVFIAATIRSPISLMP
ncbi:MAG: hypothetical protein HC925_07625 [Coleofasciculaceae cyanobacterium SM2_3_26]|nr:hypothetical protein [Coleofasciculaceae cyanobacterium SM2_3_26]